MGRPSCVGENLHLLQPKLLMPHPASDQFKAELQMRIILFQNVAVNKMVDALLDFLLAVVGPNQRTFEAGKADLGGFGFGNLDLNGALSIVAVGTVPQVVEVARSRLERGVQRGFDILVLGVETIFLVEAVDQVLAGGLDEIGVPACFKDQMVERLLFVDQWKIGDWAHDQFLCIFLVQWIDLDDAHVDEIVAPQGRQVFERVRAAEQKRDTRMILDDRT